jgi:hypothetical protein
MPEHHRTSAAFEDLGFVFVPALSGNLDLTIRRSIAEGAAPASDKRKPIWLGALVRHTELIYSTSRQRCFTKFCPMALDLHKDCLVRLKNKLAEALGLLRVNHGQFISSESLLPLFAAQSVLPAQGDQRARIEGFISEHPVVDFVQGILARELGETQDYVSKDEAVPLSSLNGYSDLKALAARLVDEFESLPWAYAVSAPLPAAAFGGFFAEQDNLVLSKSVRIKKVDEKLKQEFPLKSGIQARDRMLRGGGILASILLDAEAGASWQDGPYLQVLVDGFIGKYGVGATYKDAVDTLKAVCGLGLALRLWEVKRTYQSFRAPAKLHVHRWISGAWAIEADEELTPTESEILQDLILDTLDGQIKPDGQIGWMKGRFALMHFVLRATERNQKILLASRWLFDSYCGHDELLSFVQAAVVMEILMGDKTQSDLIGLGQLLANRCAYLIATTHSQRQEVLDDFKKIYGVRSSIVHQGKTRLSYDERTLFNKLRWMAFRVIQQEAELLSKEPKAEKP